MPRTECAGLFLPLPQGESSSSMAGFSQDGKQRLCSQGKLVWTSMCSSALYLPKLRFLASRSVSLILQSFLTLPWYFFKKHTYWKDGHVEISVSFFILRGKEKLAKAVRRAQQALHVEGFTKEDEVSWSSKISLQDSCPLSWGIQVGRSGPTSRNYSFISFSERKSQASAQLLSRQGKLHLHWVRRD